MIDNSRAMQIEASVAEEEAMDLLTYLVCKSRSKKKRLSREEFLNVVAGIRERLLVALNFHRPQVAVSEPAAPEHKLFTAEEAAAFLTSHVKPVEQATVVRWARQGRLEAGWEQVPPGRRPQWRISPRSLKRCIEVGVPPSGTYPNPPSIDDQPMTGYLESLLSEVGED